jgi:hypothetical protein
MEMEATIREKERQLERGYPWVFARSDTILNTTETYRHAAPMRYRKPLAEQTRHDQSAIEPSLLPLRRETTHHLLKDSDQEMEIMATISEPSPATEPVPPLNSGSTPQEEPAKYSNEHFLKNEPQASVTVNTKPSTIMKHVGQK